MTHLIGAACLGWAGWRTLHPVEPGVLLHLVTLTGVVFAVTGMVASHRQPHNRLGALITLVGLALFAEDLSVTAPPWGELFAVASTPALLHLTLAFPSGRLRHSLERSMVLGAYAWAVLVPIWRVRCVTSTVGDLQPCEVTRSALETGNVVVGLLVVSALLHRTLTSPPDQRRLYLPILWAALASALTGILLTLPIAPSPERVGLRVTYHVTLMLVPLAFLLGVTRAVGGMAALALVSERLRQADSPAAVESVLRSALQDPSACLGIWDVRTSRFVGSDGIALAEGHTAPVEVTVRDSLRVGLFGTPATWAEPRLVTAALHVAALALAQHAAADDERARLRRDLHDSAQQTLVAASLKLRMAEDRALSGATVEPDELADVRRDIEAGLKQLRRIGRGLPATSGADLDAALSAIAARTPAVRLMLDTPPGLDPAPVQTAYFVVAEAVTNAQRHAAATHIGVSAMPWLDDTWRIVISDNGGAGTVPVHFRSGGGLEGLRRRVEQLGGSLEVRQNGTGVIVDAVLPRKAAS